MDTTTSTQRTPTPTPAEVRIVVHDVSWATFEQMADDNLHVRLTYDQGCLEIMSPGAEHEHLDRQVSHLVLAVIESRDGDVTDLGHTTFKHPDWQKGFEPDGCYYFGDQAARMRGVKKLDPMIHPPPDLVVEIDITSSSVRKFAIFRQFGVREVWRLDGGEWSLLVLRDDYVPTPVSLAIPGLTPGVLAELLEHGLLETAPRWLRRVRAWAATGS